MIEGVQREPDPILLRLLGRHTRELTLPGEEKEVIGIKWRDLGYNALRNRVILDFGESATFGYAMQGLAGLYVLHDRLDRDWGRFDFPYSRIFDIPIVEVDTY